MATVVLTAIKGGIDRQRVVGSPSPDTLYELTNGYRDPDGVIRSRPGSEAVYNVEGDHVDAPYTVGMTVFRDAFVVYSHKPQNMPAGVTCEVLVHPTSPELAIARIHFAAPFLQYLYVAAEFAGGDVFHYWLQRAETWEAETAYCLGDLVQPAIPNGFVYIAERIGNPYPLWVANATRAIGDRVEPTTADCNYYEVVDTIGDTPRSGATEPTWNTDDGALTYEDVSTGTTPSAPTPGPTTGEPNPDPDDRYANPGGRIDYRREQ
jgi:hypothetical protein